VAIRIRTAGRCLTISDDPLLFWLFDSMFVLGGFTALFLSFAFGTSIAMTIFGAVIGLGNIAGGLSMLKREPASRIEFDAAAGTLRVVRWGFMGRRESSFPVSERASVDVETTEHTDGGKVYRPRLRLAASRAVPVSLFWYQSAAASRAAAEHIERFIRDAGSVR
jgi:hypothetical protein